MRRSGEPMTLSLPPFTGAVTWLVGINTGIYLLFALTGLAHVPLGAYAFHYFELAPIRVIQQGWIWQIVTYSFLHEGFWHLFGNMLMLWMFGSSIEGPKRSIAHARTSCGVLSSSSIAISPASSSSITMLGLGNSNACSTRVLAFDGLIATRLLLRRLISFLPQSRSNPGRRFARKIA